MYFAATMFLTYFVKTRIGGMVLIASIGVSWATTLWVPYCLLGVVLSTPQRLMAHEDGLSGQDMPEAGAIMGFHNAAISAPQTVSALVCSIVFDMLSGTESGVVWAMRIGGCWTLVAAYFSWKLSDEIESL